jgi:hypothetical protein
MLDVFNIPGQQDNVKIFYARGTGTTNDWQTWQKPRNCKFIWVMCIGGGAGGAGGQSTGLSNATAGPGGGGSGAVTRALFPANTLPDTLYVLPGPGGNGGVGRTSQAYGASIAGTRTYVSIAPNLTVMNLVCVSGATPAGIVSSATGGTGESAATSDTANLLTLANFISVAGQAGASSPGNITPLTSTIVSGGASGAACGNGGVPGGNISATTISPIISGGTSTSVNGNDGIISTKPLYFLGGAGGWGSDSTVASTGSNGGNGAYGCGGGGGGMSSGVTGGNGGKGGDGLVIIATF